MNFPSIERLWSRTAGLLVASIASLFLVVHSTAWAQEVREIDWESLVPQDWDPAAPFDRYTEVELEQMSAEEISLLEAESQLIFDTAPVVGELDEKRVKIPGFVLPLEFDGKEVREFLLVPYVGACIHVPPPPSNQIIRGQYEKRFKVEDMYTAVWISGKLEVDSQSSQLGEEGYSEKLEVKTGYSMQVETIEPYIPNQE